MSALATDKQSLDFYTYSIKNGARVKTLIRVEGQSGMVETPAKARYSLGEHSIVIALKDLEMGMSPLMSQYAPKLRSILYLPKIISTL